MSDHTAGPGATAAGSDCRSCRSTRLAFDWRIERGCNRADSVKRFAWCTTCRPCPHPSSKGARIKFQGGTRTVVDGPFAETKELIAGFWIWNVRSRAEAIDWVKRCPNPFPDVESEIEVRQIFESDDFGPEFTPELRAQEDRLRAQMAAKR